MYLLDTNICIEITKRNSLVVTRFNGCSPDKLAINTVVYAVLLAGVYGAKDPARVSRDVRQLRARVTLIPLSEGVAAYYAPLRHTLKSNGVIIGGNDLWIAAHALAFGLTLVTNNEREFRRVPISPSKTGHNPSETSLLASSSVARRRCHCRAIDHRHCHQPDHA